MAKVIVQHHVADYDKWYSAFTDHATVRKQYGATGHSITRSTDDPNNLVLINEFATADGARGFMSDPSLPDVMHRAGVDSQAQIWLVKDAETLTY